MQISDSIKTTKGATQIPTQVVALLKEFEAIFATLVGLPPNKGHEHQIQLKESAQAIVQRPYRYPFYQKNEIKKNSQGVAFCRFN